MRWVARLATWLTIALLFMMCGIETSFAQKRFALVIGNKDYAPAVGPLKNPLNDLDLIRNALTQIGFQVATLKNATRIEIRKEVSRLATKLGDAGDDAIGFLYYSGHGAARARDRINYLIPVDVRDMSDDDFWYNAVSLDDILMELESSAPRASHFVVFDACRNELRLPTKGTSKGFEPIRETNGIFIAFSTSPNHTASDIGDTGGPYARALAYELLIPGQDHLALFQNVKERVFGITADQRPWESNGFIHRLYLAGRPVELRRTDEVSPWLAPRPQVRLSPSPSPDPPTRGCPGNPAALGVSRTVEIDTTGGPGFGSEHFTSHDFLRPGEVVLTFDDGPWPKNTPAVLAALATHCTKAIFFPIGVHATYEPGILKQVAAAGHAVGSHTWCHQDLSQTKGRCRLGGKLLDPYQYDPKDEIEKGISAVRWAVGGPTAPYFRFPALRHPPELVQYLAQRNIAIFSTDVESWDFKLRTPGDVVKSVMENLNKRGKGIVLMHDFQNATAEAMSSILDQLKAGGYRVVHMIPKDHVQTLARYDDLTLSLIASGFR